MDPELKRKWIDALKSGNYKQGEGRLVLVSDHPDQTRFCCLGVLRHIVDPRDLKSHGDLGEVLHDLQLDQYGLTHSQQDQLVRMNDIGNSFDDIAEWIRGNL